MQVGSGGGGFEPRQVRFRFCLIAVRCCIFEGDRAPWNNFEIKKKLLNSIKTTEYKIKKYKEREPLKHLYVG